MEEQQKVFWSIMEKVSEDEGLRSAMPVDARSAIGREFAIKIPQDIDIVVHENYANSVHLPLQARLEVFSGGNPDEVRGGVSCSARRAVLWSVAGQA